MAAIAAWRPKPRGAVRVSAPQHFVGGEPVAVEMAGGEEWCAILHYCHVNQAER